MLTTPTKNLHKGVLAERGLAFGAGLAEADALRILRVLYHGKWRILFYALAMLALGAWYVFGLATRTYTATATIALHGRTAQIVDLESPLAALGGDIATINTELEALTSLELLERLVDEFALDRDPEFNRLLRKDEPTLLGALVGDLLSTADAPAPDAREIRERVLTEVRRAIDATNLRASYVFNIAVTSKDPEKAARLADGVATLYIEGQIALKYQTTEQATLWLNERLAELRVELDAAENALKTFNTETALVGPEALEALNRQLKDRRDRLVTIETESRALADKAAALEAARAAGAPAEIARLAGDPVLDQALARLGEGAAARDAFDLQVERVIARVRAEAARLAAQGGPLAAAVAGLDAQIRAQSEDLLRLEQLEREAQASRQIYEYFLGRLKETSVQQGIHSADSRLLSRAMVPRKASSPQTLLVLAIALMLGVGLGTLLVLLREMRSTSFRSAQELERATGLTVLAQIPRAPTSNRQRLLKYLAEKRSSTMAEAVRNLRTSVFLANLDAAPALVMVTSSLPGEGKTTLSIALAQSVADMGRRVLLIEGDIRRRSFQKYFDMPARPGLVRAVEGAAALDEAVFLSPELGCDVLLGEAGTANAADFFSSARFVAFLAELRRHYDLVVIDTPPVLIVPDARVIGQHMDMTLYAVRWDATAASQVETGLATLATVGVRVSGLVLSQIDLRKAQAYGGKYGEIYGTYGAARSYYRN